MVSEEVVVGLEEVLPGFNLLSCGISFGKKNRIKSCIPDSFYNPGTLCLKNGVKIIISQFSDEMGTNHSIVTNLGRGRYFSTTFVPLKILVFLRRLRRTCGYYRTCKLRAYWHIFDLQFAVAHFGTRVLGDVYINVNLLQT